MTHYLTLPDRKAWEAIGWPASPCGNYAAGPDDQDADIIGDNYFLKEDGTREPRPGFLVNIEGELPKALQKYALPQAPENPKRVTAK